jgi:outer membrane protein OmpA-like peptidoglycan-associated protein
MEGRKSCWHWLLLGLAGVGLLGLIASLWAPGKVSAMQGSARTVAQEALEGAGHRSMSAEVEGPFMVVRGAADSIDAREMACNAVKQTLIQRGMLGLPGVVNSVKCEVAAPGALVAAGAATGEATGAATPVPATESPAAAAAAPADAAATAAKADASACGQRLAAVSRSGSVQFELQGARIVGGQAMLDQIAALAKECAAYRIEVGGHTDARGGDRINVPLSQARAEAVRDHLIEKGVPADRLTAKGYGSSKPLMPGADVPANRRTEFTITALD